MALLIISFLGAFGVVFSVGLLLFRRDVVSDRLTDLVGGRVRRSAWVSQIARDRRGAAENVVRPFQNVLPRSAKETSLLQKRLSRAGYRQESAVNIFYGAKVLTPIALLALAFLTPIRSVGPVAYLVAAGLGFLLPDLWLTRSLEIRKRALTLGLPEALDLMVVCAEAGLSIDQTIQRVGRELRVGQPAIADELALATLEQKAGKPRDECFKDLAERANVPSVRAFVNTIVQSDAFGTSIAKSLRVYSDTLRTQRRQKAEEDAAKTTVKLVLPLVVFIFPTLFIVVLGPAVIGIIESVNKFTSNT